MTENDVKTEVVELYQRMRNAASGGGCWLAHALAENLRLFLIEHEIALPRTTPLEIGRGETTLYRIPEGEPGAGNINNCALPWGKTEIECPTCEGGPCPDRTYFEQRGFTPSPTLIDIFGERS